VPIIGYTAERSPTAPSSDSSDFSYSLAVAAHLSAAAAGVGVSDLVLDPYCGTCSLLLAAAHIDEQVTRTENFNNVYAHT
jgi:tRNA G10  N-methylase Trm11